MEAVPWITALDVAAIAFAERIDAPLVPVTGNAVFIISDEHGVVVDLRFIYGWLRALKDESGAGELCQHIPVDAAALQEVGVDPPHIRVRWRECERFPLLCGFFPRREIPDPTLTAEKRGHCVRERQTIELLNEIDSKTTLLFGVIEPLIAPDGDAVIRGEALVPSGGKELFAPPPEKLRQVDGVCPAFLFLGEMNILCDDARLQSQ